MAEKSYEEAYPGVRILPRSRNWWAWLKGSPAECIHIEHDHHWIATLLPDILYLRGKRAIQRDPARPEIALCQICLTEILIGELAQYSGRILAFEPDPEHFTQYFFIGNPDFQAAGLTPEFAEVMEKRLAQSFGTCVRCEQAATWLWFSGEQIGSLDEVEQIREAPGEALCAEHGAQRLCGALRSIPEANLFYVNLPYGESGAYVWI